MFVGSLTPVAVLLLRAVRDELGANPISQALNQLGLVALIFLGGQVSTILSTVGESV